MTGTDPRYRGNDGARQSTTAILVALVSVVAIVAAFVIALVYAGDGVEKSTPLIVVVLGLVGPTIASLAALLKTDATRQDLHNGLIPTKVQEAVEEGLTTGTLHVKEDRSGKRERTTDLKRSDDPPSEDSTGREGESVG